MSWLDIEKSLTSEPIAPDWLIPDLLPKDYTVVIVGTPGSGKSFLSMHMAMCLAGGLPFLGRETKAAPVLYLNQENSLLDSMAYLRLCWVGMDRPDVALLKANLHFAHFSLMGNNRSRFEEVHRMARDLRPALIVIDTLVSGFPPESINGENDNAEAAKQLVNLKLAQSAADNKTTIWLLKHAKEGENATQTMRGAKYWNGAADSVLFHTRTAGRPRLDGLSNTRLSPTKGRAFGLRVPITIIPTWTEGQSGIHLAGRINSNE